MSYTDIILAAGLHNLPSDGACILETEVLLAGYEWTTIKSPDDLPKCFSRVLAAYVIGLNDAMPDAERQKLKVFLGRLTGTRGTREEECARAERLVMLGAKPAAVSALHSAGLHDHAAAVAAATTLAELDAAVWSASAAEWAGARSAAAETEAEWAAKAAGRAAAKAKAAAAGSSGFDWQPYLDALDAALKIGPQAPPIKPIVAKERLSVLQEAGGTAK